MASCQLVFKVHYHKTIEFQLFSIAGCYRLGTKICLIQSGNTFVNQKKFNIRYSGVSVIWKLLFSGSNDLMNAEYWYMTCVNCRHKSIIYLSIMSVNTIYFLPVILKRNKRVARRNSPSICFCLKGTTLYISFFFGQEILIGLWL